MVKPPSLVYWALILIVLWIGLRWFEGINLYIPSRQLAAHPGTFGLPYEELWLTAEDGVRLHGWHVPAPKGKSGPTVLFLHGNGGNISDRLEKIRLFHSLGASVLIV